MALPEHEEHEEQNADDEERNDVYARTRRARSVNISGIAQDGFDVHPVFQPLGAEVAIEKGRRKMTRPAAKRKAPAAAKC